MGKGCHCHLPDKIPCLNGIQAQVQDDQSAATLFLSLSPSFSICLLEVQTFLTSPLARRVISANPDPILLVSSFAG